MSSKVAIKFLLVILSLICFVLLTFFSSCNDDPIGGNCPPYDVELQSPYEDPIWHPSGKIIGFNHKPIEKINYTNGYDCPHQAIYNYKEDSTGFWIINVNGSNKRRILPYILGTPAWSPDGNWIAFSKGAQIFKMPFNGQEFDTSSIEQLTFKGRNFYPVWSPDQSLIAYDNTNCGSATSPIPKNSCGVLIMDTDGSNKRFLGQGRMPYWDVMDSLNEYLYTGGIKYRLESSTTFTFFNPSSNNIKTIRTPSFNPIGNKIAFIGAYSNTETQFLKLFTITTNGENLQTISHERIMSFSWSLDGYIVYLKYGNNRIDEVEGTLWIMDADGNNRRQLTQNNFKLIQ